MRDKGVQDAGPAAALARGPCAARRHPRLEQTPLAGAWSAPPSSTALGPSLWPSLALIGALSWWQALAILHPLLSLWFEVRVQEALGLWGLNRWVVVFLLKGSRTRHLLPLVLLGLEQAIPPWNLPENRPERPCLMNEGRGLVPNKAFLLKAGQ